MLVLNFYEMATESAATLLGDMESLTKDPQATEDFSKQTDDLIARAQTLIKAGRLEEATDELLFLEKKSRQSCDAISCSRISCLILETFKNLKDWSTLNEYIVVLSRKRGQLKKCVADMVRMCIEWVEEITEKDVKWNLIQTLITVTEGKIFVEVERARLTRHCSRIKEKEGNLEEATTLLQEVQVETFVAMEKREKAEFILDQMRLVLLRNDFVRCQIMSRKLNLKLLESREFEDLKLAYYKYMVEYYLHEEMQLDVCKAYYAMLHSETVAEDEKNWKQVLACYAVYLILAPFDNEQKDLLVKLQATEKKRLKELPMFKQLVDSFLTKELLSWPLPYEEELKKLEVFQETPYVGGTQRWVLLRKRVLHHNIEVVGTYYGRISMMRLADLLRIDTKEVESEISELVCSKFLKAKIDRPAGSVTFGERKDTSDHLNEWSGSISKLLDLVEESCHLIQKERMVNAARLKRAQSHVKSMVAAVPAGQ